MFFSYSVFLSLLVYSASHKDYYFGKLQIVSDLLPEQCFAGDGLYIEPSAATGGLPKCGSFGETPAGVCAQYHDPTKSVVYKPTGCSKDGKFGPKQCKGQRATGRCFCYDAEGTRIFGQQWWNQASNMTCACARKKADMAASADFTDYYFNSLHCNRMGNFEPLQCDVVSGLCWCADEMTGDLTSPVVPDSAVAKLPCYNPVNQGSQYLRQCESQKYAEKRIEHELRLHGSHATFGELFLCDDDGSYGAYSVINGLTYCTWRDNSKIGSYQSAGYPIGINCKCARDSKIFAAAGQTLQQKCGGNGNYEEMQMSLTTGYCVDDDGYRKSPAEAVITDVSNCTNFEAF